MQPVKRQKDGTIATVLTEEPDDEWSVISQRKLSDWLLAAASPSLLPHIIVNSWRGIKCVYRT